MRFPFNFTSSEADEKFFRKAIYNYLRNPKNGFREMLWYAVYERNNKGETSNYLYFNERNQKLYLDNKFFDWAKSVSEEIMTIKGIEGLIRKY